MNHWKEIPGYKYRYRISREGVIQRQMGDGSWLTLKAGLYHGSERATVQMVHKDGKPRPKGVVMLMADAFMGGRRPGTWIIHRNGLRLDNRLENLEVITPKEGGRRYGTSARRKPVVKIDRRGEVVDNYRSAAEAAKKNHVGRSSVSARCREEVPKEKEFDMLGGFTFRYET